MAFVAVAACAFGVCLSAEPPGESRGMGGGRSGSVRLIVSDEGGVSCQNLAYPAHHLDGLDLSQEPPGARPITMQAHRGMGREMPENTLETFRACWRLGGIPEGDLRTSKDGVILFLHDNTLARTTDARAAWRGLSTSDLTWEELRRVDAGVKQGERFRGQRIPSGDEVFAEMAKDRRRRLYLDFKAGDLKAIAALVRKHGVAGQCLPCSRHYKEVAEASGLLPEAIGMVWIPLPEANVRRTVEFLAGKGFKGVRQIQIHTRVKREGKGIRFDPSFATLSWAREVTGKAGVKMEMLIAEDVPEAYGAMILLGVDSFATDLPTRTLGYIRAYQAEFAGR